MQTEKEWRAARFRGLLASQEPRRLTVPGFMVRLRQAANGRQVPSQSHVYAEWWRDRGYGPRDPALVALVCQILGCDEDDLFQRG